MTEVRQGPTPFVRFREVSALTRCLKCALNQLKVYADVLSIIPSLEQKVLHWRMVYLANNLAFLKQ